MTHIEKLDAILRALLYKETKADSKLDFDSLYKILFDNEEIIEWEIKFIKKRLLSDDFISENTNKSIEITSKGTIHIQAGGYKGEDERKKRHEQIEIKTLKSIRFTQIILIITTISSIIFGILTLILK